MKKFALCLMIVVLAGCGVPADKSQEASKTATTSALSPQYLQQGFAQLQQGDIPSAIKNFDEAIRNNPADPSNYIVLGQVYLQLRNLDRAVDSFNGALRVDPNHAQAYFMLATTEAMRGKVDEAIESAKRSAELSQVQQDPEGFKRAVMLVQSLQASLQPANVEAVAVKVVERKEVVPTVPTVTIPDVLQ